MRITSKGQVTIPQHIREQAGLMPGTDVVFTLVEGEVRLRKDKASGGRREAGGEPARQWSRPDDDRRDHRADARYARR